MDQQSHIGVDRPGAELPAAGVDILWLIACRTPNTLLEFKAPGTVRLEACPPWHILAPCRRGSRPVPHFLVPGKGYTDHDVADADALLGVQEFVGRNVKLLQELSCNSQNFA